jgi:hypothetical protein
MFYSFLGIHQKNLCRVLVFSCRNMLITFPKKSAYHTADQSVGVKYVDETLEVFQVMWYHEHMTWGIDRVLDTANT